MQLDDGRKSVCACLFQDARGAPYLSQIPGLKSPTFGVVFSEKQKGHLAKRKPKGCIQLLEWPVVW